MAGSASPRWTTCQVGAALWGLALLVVLFGSWRPAWSGDEAASVMVVRRSLPELVQTFRFDPALEPYYLFLKLWSSVSTSHVWLRLPSILAMATAIALTFALMSRIASRRLALLAALVMIALPASSRWGQEARPYAFALLFVVIAAWCSTKRHTDTLTQALTMASVVLTGLAHAYALLAIPVIIAGASMDPTHDRRQRVVRTATACAAGVIVLSPFLWFVALHATGQPRPPTVSAFNIAVELLRLPVGVLRAPLGPVLAAAVGGLAVAGLGMHVLSGGWSRRLGILLTAWLVAPPAALIIFQATTNAPGLVARYWLWSLPAMAAAAATPLARPHQMTAITASMLVIVALAVPTHLTIRTVDGHQGQRWTDLFRVLELPALRTAPLIVRGSDYRALVAHDPHEAHARMPLVKNAAASGRVNPDFVRPQSRAFRRFERRHDLVVVYCSTRHCDNPKPRQGPDTMLTAQSFDQFRRELRSFPQAVTLCNYYDDALGVFVKPVTVNVLRDAEQITDQISGIAPHEIECGSAS